MITPDPVPVAYIRNLCEHFGNQRAAARALHVDPRTVRKWCGGDRGMPWASAELLRRMVAEISEQAAIITLDT